ncbi:SNF1-interacting protein [Mortierella claussenii]|nr:SNF1-interacting protein [Mortierella claussenii]
MSTVPTNPPSVPPGPTATEGVAAMIPVANITLEDALLDNPNFRANIKLFEGQVFFIENWLVALQRSMNQFTEEWQRLNEVTSVLNKRAEVPLLSQGMLSSQYTIPAMRLTGEAFRTTLALKNKYISEVNDQVLKPLDDFLKNDLKDFKDSKKMFDKALEKYESTLAKYNGQSRQKEPSALREEAFQLYDTRKAYIQAAMACSMLCIKFQESLDQLVLGVFLDLIATQHDYFSGNADHFGSMALQVLQLKTYMKGHKEASATTLQELEQNKERYTADAIEYWKPSRSLKCYSNNTAPSSKSTLGHAALGPAFAAQMAGQVPISTLMTRPATISHTAAGGGSHRLPLPTPSQFQSQSTSALLGNQNISGSLDSLPSTAVAGTATDAPSNSTGALARGNNVTSLSIPNSGATNSQASLSNPTTPSSANFHQTTFPDSESTPTTKQGYLNIRIPQPKNRAPVWQRKYFFIQEGEFGFESVVSNPTVGSQVVQSERIAVLLCEVRYGSSSNSLLTLSGGGNPVSGSQGLAMMQMERRFCFEVVCVTQSYLLQAETEDDLMSWVNTFEAAKRDVLQQQNTPHLPEPDEPYSPIPDSANQPFSFSGDDLLTAQTSLSKSADEEEDPKPTGSGSGASGLGGWAANVPVVSLLLNSYAAKSDSPDNTTTSTEKTSNAPPAQEVTALENNNNTALVETTMTDIPPPPNSLQHSSRPSTLDTDTSIHARSRSVGDMPAGGHTHQLSEIEKLMNSSLHLVPKASPLAVSEIPHYPMELVVRNRELHLRFHGTKLHSKEYVLHSWTSGYRDDSRPGNPMTVYGRIFLTQSGMYFYARDLSVETKRMYRFSSIRGIECEQKDILTEWRIETMDGVEHVFHQFTLTDTEYQVLHLIWTNVHQAKDRRLPVKELFRRAMLLMNKPKSSAGSGSLAEMESGHFTTREGTISRHASSEGKALPHETRQGDIGSEAASMNGDDEDWDDSDEGLPAGRDAPSGPVACDCSGHLERNELNQTFDISAKTLSQWLFGENSPVWKEFHDRRNNKVQSIGEWQQTGDHKTRTVKFLMVVNNPLVKLNQTDCIETHTCEVDEEYLRYSYTVKSNVQAMPYSDAFTPVLRYCITYVSPTQSRLVCSSAIEWHKNPMVKAMIKGAVLKGTAETVKDLSEIIQMHLEKRKVGGQNGGGSRGTRSAPASTRAVVNAVNEGGSDMSKVTISLHGPDDDAQSILFDPVDEKSLGHLGYSMVDGSKGDRTPGGRRHTVSTTAMAASSGARVQGHWPTGSQPLFVPIGSKESRTRLLGRPSRSTLADQHTDSKSEGNKDDSELASKYSVRWIKKNLLRLIHHAKDEKERRSVSTKLLCLVLVVSSLINTWAAYNSQRMLNSAWRWKEHGSLSGPARGSRGHSKHVPGFLRGYPEPLHRMLNHLRDEHLPSDDDDHVWSHPDRHRDGVKNVRVAARAVYLKDLEEQMQNGELEGFDDARTVDQKCFEIFLEVRESFRSWPQPPLEEWQFEPQNESSAASSSSNSGDSTSTSLIPVQPTSSPSPSSSSRFSMGSGSATRYPWLLPHHRRWATRIIFQRDRVGILRHDLLVTFEVLKQLERRLLETEYVNWLMDERSRCRLWERRRKLKSSSSMKTDDDTDGDEKVAGRVHSSVKGVRTTSKNIEEFLLDLEPQETMSHEEVTQRISNRSIDQVDGEKESESGDYVEKTRQDEDSQKEQQFKIRVTEEFCQGLEHQVRLFMLDSKPDHTAW